MDSRVRHTAPSNTRPRTRRNYGRPGLELGTASWEGGRHRPISPGVRGSWCDTPTAVCQQLATLSVNADLPWCLGVCVHTRCFLGSFKSVASSNMFSSAQRCISRVHGLPHAVDPIEP